jgi:hypothetical protein
MDISFSAKVNYAIGLSNAEVRLCSLRSRFAISPLGWLTLSGATTASVREP